MSVIPAFAWMRQEDQEFQASLGCIERPCLRRRRGETLIKMTTGVSISFQRKEGVPKDEGWMGGHGWSPGEQPGT
jgi:hypothetical protein